MQGSVNGGGGGGWKGPMDTLQSVASLMGWQLEQSSLILCDAQVQ